MKDIKWQSTSVSGVPRGWIAGNKEPANGNAFITIENCEFSNARFHMDNNDLAGIFLKGPHDLKIINNYFHDMWGCPIQTMSNTSSSIHEDVYNYYVIRNKFINILGSRARIIRMRYLNPNDGLANTSKGFEGLYHHVEIDSNYFYKIGNTCIYDEQEEQWWLQEKLGYAINVIGNEFHQVANVAIDISSVRDRYNTGWMYWSGNKIDSSGYDSLGNLTMSDPTNAIQTHGAHQLIIENNQINYVQSSSGDGNGIIIDHAIRLKTSNPPGTGIPYTCDTVIVRNNIITHCWRSANDKASGINIFKGKRSWVYNNIVDQCQVGYKVEVTGETNYNYVFNNIWNGSSVYGVQYSSTSGQNYFTNNIISNNAIGAYMSTSNSGKLDYNQWYNNSIFYEWSSPSGVNDITSALALRILTGLISDQLL